MRNLGMVAAVVVALGGIASADRPAKHGAEIYVTIASASDASHELDGATRHLNVETICHALQLRFDRTPQLTSSDAAGLIGRQVDLSITKLAVKTTPGFIEISAELRLVVSDRRGEILSSATGGATVSVPRHTYREADLPRLRKQALEEAADGMFRPLRTQLLRAAFQSS